MKNDKKSPPRDVVIPHDSADWLDREVKYEQPMAPLVDAELAKLKEAKK